MSREVISEAQRNAQADAEARLAELQKRPPLPAPPGEYLTPLEGGAVALPGGGRIEPPAKPEPGEKGGA